MFVWLSAIRYALICAGVRSLATTNGNLVEAELVGGLPTGVADDDHAVGVQNTRLLEPEFPDRGGDRIDGVVVDARVLGIRLDVREFPQLDLHG